MGNDNSAKVNVCYQRRCCFFKCAKEHQKDTYTRKDVISRLKYIQSHYRYEMFEDVHQVANYLELKAKEKPNDQLIADYAFMSLRVVLMSVVIQMILVANLAWEVF
jgi:hypothetical protein